MNWRLNRIQHPVYNLGPGKRIGIWVQGCSIRCENCLNRSLWDCDAGKEIHVLAVVDFIIYNKEKYDGITITGGEAFDQYSQLMAFAMMIKRKTNLNILVYSGYYLSELNKKFQDKAFYQCIDYLIDGPFDIKKRDNNNIKGSTNQSVYRFENSKAIAVELNNCQNNKLFSLHCNGETIYMAGIPEDGLMESIEDNFKNNHICWENF